MFQGEKLFWIGIRESEISATGQLFDGSITIFGSNTGNNYSFDKEHHIRINYNEDNEELGVFINKTITKILKEYPKSKFLLYYPMEAQEYTPIILEHIVCINSSALTDLLENKLYTKLWLTETVPVIPFTTMLGVELNYTSLCDAFPNENSFVIQGTFSCGGSGTWLVSQPEEIKELLEKIDSYNIYTVTPYKKESVSVNMHLLIYEKAILLFPASVQVICKDQQHLCYGGADFILINKLPQNIKNKIQEYGQRIGKRLQEAGYRGICGIDFLTTLDEVFFMEINARFQSSSFLINDILKEKSLPSLQELHIDAFLNDSPSYTIPELTIPRSFYNYSFVEDAREQLQYIWELGKRCPEVLYCIDDELDWDMSLEDSTYLFKFVFNTNIACVAPKYSSRIYNGLDYHFSLLKGIPWNKQLKRLKVLLLNQGIRISKRALKQLEKSGGPNYDIFYAIDLSIEEKFFFNVPYKVDFSELSPFEITYEKEAYRLNYYGTPLAKVSVRTNDPLAHQLTQNGVPYNEIAYLGVDRLRIHQRSGCFFKEHHIGCSFCDIEPSAKDFSLEDIKEVLQAYKNTSSIQHYLIGGGSQNPSDDFENVLKIVECIRKTDPKNIYLMSIPPEDVSVLTRLKAAGVTEVAFNIEVYDRNLAFNFMPGKGRLPLERYEKAFKKAIQLWGKTGSVRSALVVGLEPADSVLRGVEFLCRLGVSPILALLKPANQLENFWAPESREVLDIWEKTESICRKYRIPLGPSCRFCEDNVLKINLEEHSI